VRPLGREPGKSARNMRVQIEKLLINKLGLSKDNLLGLQS
jgi:hypothetical protein